MLKSSIIFMASICCVLCYTVLNECIAQDSAAVVNRSPLWSFGHSEPTSGFYYLASGNLDPSDPNHELLVNQPFFDGGAGRVYYFSDLQDSIPDFIFTNPRGNNFKTLFGASMSTGDINGDGLTDILIGERTQLNNNPALHSGQVYIYFNKSTGNRFESKPDKIISNPGIDFEGARDNFGDHIHVPSGSIPSLYTPAGKEIRFFVGARNQDQGPGSDHSYGAVYGYDNNAELVWSVIGDKYSYLGKWIETADIDHSGSPDLLIGGSVPTNEDLSPEGGMVQVWPGNMQNRLDSAASYTLSHPEALLETGRKNLNFGYRITTGDLTGDGITDLVISDPNADQQNSAVYLYEGPLSGPFDTPEWILRGKKDTARYEFPRLRGLNTGDINRDGTDDLIIGAPSRAVWSGNARVYLVPGGPLSAYPGSGKKPRVAWQSDINHAFGSPGTGTFGEHGLLVPLLKQDGAAENMLVVPVLNSGKKKFLKVYVFKPDL